MSTQSSPEQQDRPLRIALLTSTRERCGIAEYSRHLAAALARLVALDVVPVDPQPLTPDTFARLNAADVIHLQHEYSFFGSALPGRSLLPRLLRPLRRPWVVTAHTVGRAEEILGVARTGWRSMAKRLALRARWVRWYVEAGPFASARRVIVHGSHARERLIAAGLRPERVVYLPMPVPPVAPEGAPGSASLCGERYLLTFGFLTPEKGIDQVLEVLAEYPGLLVVAGETRGAVGKGYLAQLQSAARALGVAGRVRFLGYVSDDCLDPLIRGAELVVLPYRSGTGSYALGRALACGAPVVASDLDLFDDYPCTARFGRRAGQSLREVIRALADAPERRRALGEAAREYAARHTWETAARRHVELYRAAAL
ncbi:MAG: glycosyltransferase family 4 protein [Armatimonadetes bacterium]|nr:glycosyltransferase family 4 protein [Armatimonadota bacterium]